VRRDGDRGKNAVHGRRRLLALRDPRAAAWPGQRSAERCGPGRRSLELASERGCRTLAIPAIGAGVGGLSIQRCAEILLEEARAHLSGETTLEEVRFVLFGEPAYRVFESAQDAAKVRAQMERLGAGG
jgi:O-acetyl-ADP-ribose deacetylase (regulator of RNase III)